MILLKQSPYGFFILLCHYQIIGIMNLNFNNGTCQEIGFKNVILSTASPASNITFCCVDGISCPDHFRYGCAFRYRYEIIILILKLEFYELITTLRRPSSNRI